MTSRIEIGSLVLETTDGGQTVRMTCGSEVTVWPRTSSPHFPTFGEELAQALAVIDGTFTVRSRRQ